MLIHIHRQYTTSSHYNGTTNTELWIAVTVRTVCMRDAITCANVCKYKAKCLWSILLRCVRVCAALLIQTMIYSSNRLFVQLLYLSECARLYSVHMSSTSMLLIRVCMSVIRYMKRLTVPFAFTLVRFTVAILKHLNNTLSCTIEHVILANILTKHYHRWQWLEWPMQIRNNEFCAHKVSRKLCVFVKIETDSLPPFNPHCT